MRRTIAELEQNEARVMTGFTKDQLQRLLRCWRVPREFHMEGRYTFEAEECMLLYLTDIRKGEPYTELAKKTFGGDPREFTYMVRAFTNHLYETFYHRISGNSMAYWIPHINEFRHAIWRRFVSGHVSTTEYDEFEDEERETTRHHVDIPLG